MEQIRSFVAIELPSEITSFLSSVENRMKAGCHCSAKWVDPLSIHLTLKFLGNIPVTKVTDVIEAVASVVQRESPFNLKVGGSGAFPNWHRVQIVWIGVEGDVERLIALQKAVDIALVPLGFSPETRTFVPHLTLARLQQRTSPRERAKFGEKIEDML